MKPRPKFCVGEEVLFDSLGEDVPSGEAEITAARYLEEGHPGTYKGEPAVCSGGWHYCSTNLEGLFAHEKHFKKRPPEQRTQWKDCAWQPNKQGVSA